MSIRNRILVTAAIAATALAGTTAHAQTYQKFQKVVYANTCFANGPHHNVPCCSVDGLDRTGDEINHPTCPTLYDIDRVQYSCATNKEIGVRGKAAQRCCSCGPTDMRCAGGQNPDTLIPDSIIPEAYECSRAPPIQQPEQCDGLGTGALPIDQGCQGDEHKCHTGDSDPAPIRYSSGRVESNPIELFSVPTPGDILFGYRLTYNSQVNRFNARREIILGVHDETPSIHHSQQDTHYVGLGWLDNFSDRLQIVAPNTPATTITWASQNGTVTFSRSGDQWKSWSGKFELLDRGATPADGLGRWVIRSVDTNTPRQAWVFEEVTYTPYDGGAVKTLGRLRRRAILTSNLSDLAGRYGFTVSWSPQGTIINAVDTLGRQLEFTYEDESECIEVIDKQPPNNCAKSKTVSMHLTSVQYRPNSEATAVTIASLMVDKSTDRVRLERVERPAMAGYTRFLYRVVPPGTECTNCGALLTDVIVPGDAATSTPAPLAAVLPSEIVLEHDDYGPSPAFRTMVGVHSKAPGREYAYEYTATKTTQFDLHQGGGPCGAGNTCATPGFACRTLNQLTPRCYATDVMTHSQTTGLPTSHATFNGGGGGAPGGSGNAKTFTRNYTPTGAPQDVTDASGSRKTYGYDSSARIRCIVDGDNDTQAFSDPAHPDTSACAGPGPTVAKVVQIDYGATSVTTTTPGVLGANTTRVETLDPNTLLRTASTVTGFTKDIDGAVHPETHTTRTSYDELGREVLTNGPLDDAEAYDAVETVYYTTPDLDWPYNLGQVHSESRFVGTAAANVKLTTTYAEYDLLGVPHRVIEPNGAQLVYTSSPDRIHWTISMTSPDGVTSLISSIVLNANGSLRSQQDADSVCVTYEYADATGYVGVPTAIRRSNTGCGVLPIDQNSDEVEVRTYVEGEPDRLESITRKTNGVVELSYAGFTYDRDRRLIASSTADAVQPFAYSFTGVLLSSVTAPGGPAPGSWKTEIAADAQGRPSGISRFVDATNKQTYGYGYTSMWSASPTSMTRGFNGSASAVTTFAYDDFGRLLEATTPEVGRPTRYEYDVADRLVRRREGVGAAEVNTTTYNYDSLGRTTYVAHAVERAVNCAAGGAAAGTPIQDEEYAYDRCAQGDRPDGFECANALGRLTMSRSIEQCGTHGDVIKRGRWYNYDSLGRVNQVAYATATGAGVGAPAVMTYSYDAAGRPEAYTSPLNAAFGTRYHYGAKDGRIASITTTADPARPLARDMTYRAFGELVHYVTGSTQIVVDGTRTLHVTNTYRGDDSLIGIAQSYIGEGGANSIDLLQQALAYTPAGLLRRRDDTGDPASSRHYEYDAVQRMTCEVRGDGTGADCNAASDKLAGLFSYGDGQSAASPPDARLSAIIKAPSGPYTSATAESYAYAGGSGRPLSVTRSDGDVVIGYDGLGRRVFEYQAVGSPTAQALSRRDYTYLPNGQLGQVQGWTPAGAPYTVAIRYDAEGRPSTLAYSTGDTYELFWDDMNRLVAASIGGARSSRWSYHYAGQSLVAATRETVGASTEVKRFWPVTDERGLIFRMVDEVGATHWQAHWDATAWRSLDGTPQPDMWVPFGLAGQLILEGTEASPGTGTTSVRPSIVLNQLRAYDPLFGAFLQPDPADQSTRLLPEGYLLARGDYLGHEDGTGARSSIRDEYNRKWIPPGWELRFDSSCASRQNSILVAINQAIADIDKCNLDWCRFADNLKRQWTFALLTGVVYCVQPNGSVQTPIFVNPTKANKSGQIVDPKRRTTNAFTHMGEGGTLGGRASVFGTSSTCLKQTMAHEAMHGVLKTFPMSLVSDLLPRDISQWEENELYYGNASANAWTWKAGAELGTEDAEHDAMARYLDSCVNCGKK